MKKILPFILKAIVFIAIFYYIFHDVKLDKILYSIKQYNFYGICITFLVVFIGDIFVAYRLYYLCHKKCNYKTALEASMLSLVANSFIPAKMGEISKIFYIYKKENIKKRRIFSAIIFERFSDIVSLSLLLIVSSYIFISNDSYYIIAVLIIFIGAVSIVLLKNHYLLLKKIVKKIKFRKVKIYVYLFIKEIYFHLSDIHIFKLLFISFIIWCIYVLTNVVFFKYGVLIDISFMKIFAISMIAFAVTALPITPGGIGTFQAVFILALTPKGISKENIIAATFILQFLYILPSILYLLYMLYIDKGLKNVFTK